jgi:hypothetical protein
VSREVVSAPCTGDERENELFEGRTQLSCDYQNCLNIVENRHKDATFTHPRCSQIVAVKFAVFFLSIT